MKFPLFNQIMNIITDCILLKKDQAASYFPFPLILIIIIDVVVNLLLLLQ